MQLNHSTNSFQPNNTMAATGRSEAKDLSRMASKCPIVPCAEKISEASLLCHLLSDHKELDFKPVQEAEKVTLNLEEKIFPYGQPVCIGALLYGGRDSRSRPGQSGLSQRNSVRSTEWSHCENHLAVLVMGCKTHLTDMIADDDIPPEMYNDICQRREAAKDGSQPEKDIFVLWLIGPTTFRAVFGVLRLSDAERVEVRGDRVQIRDFNTFLIPKRFLSDGLDFLMVNRGAMNLLTAKGKQPVRMEIFIEEDRR